MSAAKVYLKGVHDQLGYRGTWLPTTHIEVGDIGTMSDGMTFIPTSSLSARGVLPRVIASPGAADLSMSVGGDVQLTIKARGSALDIAPSIPKAKAGVVVSFGRRASAVLAMTGCVQRRFQDIEAVKKQLASWWNHYDWNRDLYVITEVVTAKKATVLVSEQGSAKFELTASVSADLGEIDISNLSTGFKLTGSYNAALSLVGRSNLTPMFRALRVNFWGGVEHLRLQQFDSLRLAKAMPDTYDARFSPADRS